MPKIKGSGLHSAVAGLQQVLTDSAAQGASTADAIRRQAEAAQYPYPELAAQVFQFLQGRRETPRLGLSLEEISEAFMSLLMDGDALEMLGRGPKSRDAWVNVRNVLRNTGFNFGTSLLDVYHEVRKTGLGYTPTLFQLANAFKQLFADVAAAIAAGRPGPQALAELAEQQGLYAWQIALASAWMKRRKDLSPPTDADLEEMLADAELLAELKGVEGPWDIYSAQGEVLRMLRHFGEAMLALADEVDPE